MLPTIHINPDPNTPITQGERAQLACWLAAWTAERASKLACECGPRSKSDLAKATAKLREARRFYGLAVVRGGSYECPAALLCAAQAGMIAAKAIRLAEMRITEYRPRPKAKSKRKTHEKDQTHSA